MTDAISPFPLCAASHTHTLSLSPCLSAIQLSSPPSPFDIKMLSDNFRLSMNKWNLLRTVRISKVTSIQKNKVAYLYHKINYLNKKFYRKDPSLFEIEKESKMIIFVSNWSDFVSDANNQYFHYWQPGANVIKLFLSTIYTFLY